MQHVVCWIASAWKKLLLTVFEKPGKQLFPEPDSCCDEDALDDDATIFLGTDVTEAAAQLGPDTENNMAGSPPSLLPSF